MHRNLYECGGPADRGPFLRNCTEAVFFRSQIELVQRCEVAWLRRRARRSVSLGCVSSDVEYPDICRRLSRGRSTSLDLSKVRPGWAIIIEAVNMAFIVRKKALFLLGQTLADLERLRVLQKP